MQNFNYHTHTYRCGHADNISDEKYVEEAIKIGLKELAFTDHAPMKSGLDDRREMRMAYDQKQEYLDSINALKEKYKGQIKILAGFEVEYIPGLEKDLLELRKDSDLLVLGQHFVLSDGGQDISRVWAAPFTERELLRYAGYIESATKMHLVDIIAHPDLYLLNTMQHYGELENAIAYLICESAAEHRTPLEINLSRIATIAREKGYDINDTEHVGWLNEVEYPNKRFWESAAAFGDVPVIYGIDAHHEGEIENFQALQRLAEIKLGDKIINHLKFVEDSPIKRKDKSDDEGR